MTLDSKEDNKSTNHHQIQMVDRQQTWVTVVHQRQNTCESQWLDGVTTITQARLANPPHSVAHLSSKTYRVWVEGSCIDFILCRGQHTHQRHI